MFGNMGPYMNSWGYTLMAASVLALWGLLGLAAFALSRGTSRRFDDREMPPGRAEQLLAERYARGELDADEYRKHLAVLRDNTPLTKGG
ncbi:SHOCT domain-containing protein [Streptomyces sp. cg35]|uniref:SHOCT domain-containing protein n=1 Tax=Streptomyces sp. cg35 TaxID=3421650 RepID=UPI003D1804D8